MKAKEFDELVDRAQEDVLPHLDLNSVRKPNQPLKRVNVDFPLWMVEALDEEASRVGVTRQSIIKVWLSERLQQEEAPRS